MISLMTVKEGEQLRLRDGSTREVLENFGDGIWLQMRVVDSPAAPDQVGSEDMVHCEEIIGLANGAAD